jgi:hypothetical protein
MPVRNLPRWIGALALCGFLLACGRPEVEPGRGTGTQSALAVWSYRDLAGSESEQRAFFAFATQRGIRDLYLGAAELLPQRAEALTRFLEAAQNQGIRVSLVLGRAAWTRPAQRAIALEAVRAVRTFDQAQARRGGVRLAALQLDVEPHTLPDWERDGTKLAGQFLDLLEALKLDLAGTLPLQVAIPWWWQNRPIKRSGQARPLSEWAIRLSDCTVLMDYRNQEDLILKGALGPLASARDLGKPVVVGLAVHCDRDPENASTSFCRLGDGALQKALRKTGGSLSRQPAFAGFAVFTYEDWAILRR